MSHSRPPAKLPPEGDAFWRCMGLTLAVCWLGIAVLSPLMEYLSR